MKKLLKIVLWTLAILLVAVLALVLLLPLWSGPVVRGIANTSVPQITKTGFNMGGFGLNPYTGKLSITDTALQNPERFFTSSRTEAKEGEGALGAVARVAGNAVAAAGDALASSETNALSFSEISVNLGMLSLLCGNVHIEDILVKDLFLYGDVSFSNFREIANNASGEKKEEKEEKPAEEEKEEPKAESGSSVIIDHILITGMKIKWGHVVVPLPDIELKDLGKEKDKTSGDQIVEAVCDAANKANAGLGTALEAAIKGKDSVVKAVGGAVDAAGDAVGSAKEAAGAAADAAKDAAGTVGDAAKGAADAVGDAAKSAADAAKGAIDAVGNMFK